LFLNLEKAGDYGFLYIYKNPLSETTDGYDLYAKYYIKNISDDKPKFLLSAYNIVKDDYEGFILEDGTAISS
jgi:hypothetical protein